jgi:poly-gamma-glutamate synthesis protein (capsule biosynthesis protein)
VGVVLLFVSCVLARASAGQASPGAELKKDLRLIFVGDIMTHKEQLESARGSDGEWNFTPQFRRVKPLFRFAGQNRSGGVLVTGNLETVFAGEKRGFAGYPSFNTPDALADALADLGMNVLTLANNHILDRGFSGAKRTTEVLDGTGLLWTGLEQKPGVSFDVLTAEEAGLKIAFVNYSYGSNRMLTSSTGSPDISLNTISDAAVTEGLARALLSSPDFVAACFHWGNEYQTAPTKRQKALAALSIEHGADLVIGTHPHVLQPVEILSSDRSGSGRNDRPAARHFVAYSLGNFVSYQRTPPRERSVVLAVDIEKTSEDIRARVLRVYVAPVWVSARRTKGRRLVEVVYAGESARFNHAGLPSKELAAARTAGKSVLEFLGAVGSADEEGFYTLWDAVSPDVLPVSRRKSPL